MIKLASGWWLLLVLTMLQTTGCGTYMAHRMVQAPNSYPQWLAPDAPVLLAYSPAFLTNFPKQFVTVGPPPARLCYRVIEPADYDLKVTATNWLEHGSQRTGFTFTARLPAPANDWTAHPRGTVVLLHGYALAQFSMAPWALRLAQAGWRCVLVDLRGHGRSTGDQIYYGVQEPRDLSGLLDELGRTGQLQEPVAAFGESYGAAMALRWQAAEPRVRAAVAISPYASLSNAVMNLRGEYASWLPKSMIRAGLTQLPGVLGVSASELDTTTIVARNPEAVLFVSAASDRIAPMGEVEQLRALAAPASQLVLVPEATHETVLYHFEELVPPVINWLALPAGR